MNDELIAWIADCGLSFFRGLVVGVILAVGLWAIVWAVSR